MDADTERIDRLDPEPEDQGEADAYWRRRVYVLAAGIAAVGLVAWSCSGSSDKKPTAQVRNAAVAVSPTATPTGSAGPLPTATVTVTASPDLAPPVPRRSGDRCDDGSVVLGLMPTGTVFKGKQHPRFGLSVVNTGRRGCTFDVGPKALQVRIASGTDRVWSSAQCTNGTGSTLQLLRRGVPYLATVDWDRKRCDGTSKANPGTYVITATANGTKPQRQIFRLR